MAWTACGLAVAGLAATLVLLLAAPPVEAPSGYGSIDGIAVEAAILMLLPVLAAVIASRRPHNPLGWLLLLGSVSFAAGDLAGAWAFTALWADPGSLPGGPEAAWAYQVVWVSGFAVVPLVLVLFPDGRLLGRRWWVVPGAVILATALVAGPVAWHMWPVRGLDLFLDPDTVDGLDPAYPWFTASTILFMLGVVGTVAHQAVRFRRSRGVERQQLKWLVAAAGAWAGFIVTDMFLDLSGRGLAGQLLSTSMFMLIPAAIAVAILRHRLYDIDRLVSRTVSYLLLTAVLGSVYAALVFLLGTVLPFDGDAAIAVSTLAVAAAFAPLRRTVQRAIDHRFNRARFDAARTIDGFSRRLRHNLELRDVAGELAAVASSTMEPTALSLWLRGVRG